MARKVVCKQNIMIGQEKVYETLKALGIEFDYVEHPEAPTIEIAKRYWSKLERSTHCKNLFFRNHKGSKHYLVVFDCDHDLAIHDLEKRLKQGKLSFASEARMEKYLGLRPGSVSPFGLVNPGLAGHPVGGFYPLHGPHRERVRVDRVVLTKRITIKKQEEIW